MLSWFENPVIFLFENIKVCHDCFFSFRKIAHADRGEWLSSEWRMGYAEGTIRYSPFTIR